MKKIISFVMALAIVAATAVAPSVPASAEQTDIWQVNGKYTLTKKKIKKSQIGKYIKKIKKSSYFQFKFKKGKVTEIHYCED